MRTPTEALKEIRDRLTYFCLRTDGRYDPPWATELVGIIDETTTDSHAVGNAAAMRDALKKIYDKVNGLDEECGVDPVEIRDLARAALALPSCNCDVGTAEEQKRRFNMFCKRTGDRFGESAYCVYSCPCGEVDCKLEWAQMPYAEQEGGAK